MLLFFLVLTPVAWIYRLGHRNMLQLRRAPSASSYFFELNRTVSRDDFGKMW